MEEAISYALEHANDIANARLDEEAAKAQIGETRAAGLPQITGNAQLTHSDPLRRMFMGISDDNPLLGEFAGTDELPDGSVIAMQNFFQLPSTGEFGVSINQLIFNGSYFVGLSAAKAYRELATRTTQQSRIQTVEKVTKAFYTVLINEERLGLFDENVARLDSLLRDTEQLYENGFAEKIDVSRVQVSLNNLEIERKKFKNLSELSRELLKFQMNYPMDRQINIAGNVRDLNTDWADLELSDTEFDYANRVEYSLMETRERLMELDVKNNKAKYLPTISAFANFGYFTQSPDIGGLFSTQTQGIPETPLVGPDKWYGYGIFGVSLNLPIFEGLSKSYQTQKAKINLMKVRNDFEYLKTSIQLQVNQARISLTNSLSSLEGQRENVALAEEVAQVTKIKYLSGMGSNFEVTEAETALKEAQTNYYNALYDVIIAQVDLQVALGTLVD